MITGPLPGGADRLFACKSEFVRLVAHKRTADRNNCSQNINDIWYWI